MGLTAAEGKKLECFKRTANNIFKYCGNLVKPLWSKVRSICYLTQTLSMFKLQSLCRRHRQSNRVRLGMTFTEAKPKTVSRLTGLFTDILCICGPVLSRFVGGCMQAASPISEYLYADSQLPECFILTDWNTHF